MDRFNEYIAFKIFAQDSYMHYLNNPKQYSEEHKNNLKGGSSEQNTLKNGILDQPYSTFMKREIEWMPVLRIFGCTKRGQTVCGNIHNYLPYLFIEFPYELFKRYSNQNQSEFVFELAKEMEEQFNLCEKKKHEGKRYNYVYKQLIHDIKILKGFNRWVIHKIF
jgi:hypothetical protein